MSSLSNTETAEQETAQPETQGHHTRIAVLVPCYNEAVAITGVVEGFRRELPSAAIYVYDNNSSDGTREIAEQAGAIVRIETLQGKGHVVRRMFADIDADVYVLVDGDGTYKPETAPIMVQMLLKEHLDMVNGTRVTTYVEAYRRGHRFGNALLSGMVGWIFGDRIADMMSGYRVFSRRYIKSFPALSSGFETETEMTIHALELNMPVAQIDTPYLPRMEGSSSKLRTYSDGLRILRTIVRLMKEERPLQFFTIVSVVLFLLGIGLSVPVFVEFERTGLVPRLPTAVLSTGIVLVSFLSMICGLILDSVALGRKETKRLAYLSIPFLRRTE